MKIDHVSVAGRDLRALEGAFAAAGMKAEYGGPHSSGLTKMSLLGFRDGSYIELISKVTPGSKPSIWRKQIEEDGGPCAWAIEVEDIAAEVKRAKSLWVTASGPDDYARKRPDGVTVEWKLGFLGDEEPGALLPFMIKDTTPRDYRVTPSPSVSGPDSVLEGIAKVIIGVDEISGPAGLFKTLYGWEAPVESDEIWEGVTVASFEHSPVALAAPKGPGWLHDRLAKFGTSPCAFLISTPSLRTAGSRYPLGEVRGWFDGKRVSWVEPLWKGGMNIGVVGT